MKNVDRRLQRLIESDICQVDDAEEYRSELIQLANVTADIRTAKKQSKFFKALSDEKRIRILNLLRVREMCICELMIALNMTQPNLSHHLKILDDVDIVSREKKGKWVYCSIENKNLIEDLRKIDLL
jgi:ArsR family transcriptional regulator